MKLLDLNTPLGARIYIRTWIEAGRLTTENNLKPKILEDGSVQEQLMAAKQLFLYYDDRPSIGSDYH